MAVKNELTIVFIGSPQKEVLFEKMKSAAVRFEKHVSYQDTYYLTYVIDGSEVTVELVDPGLEHTGAREMSIRKADGAILFYQASCLSSFNQLCDLAHDFQMRRSKNKLPIILIGNEDDAVHTDDACLESTSASLAEQCESDSVHPLTIENVPNPKLSTDLIRQSHENPRVLQPQGQHMAEMFGPYCKFVSLAVSNFDGTFKLMEEMIRTIQSQQQRQRRNLLQRLKKIHEQRSIKKMKTTVSSKTCTIM